MLKPVTTLALLVLLTLSACFDRKSDNPQAYLNVAATDEDFIARCEQIGGLASDDGREGPGAEFVHDHYACGFARPQCLNLKRRNATTRPDVMFESSGF